MSFDGVFINKLVGELNNTIEDARISKIYQLGNNDFVFKIRKKDNLQLFISTNPRYQRIHLTTMDYEKPKTPYNFCMFLRKYLEGGIIKNILQHSNDRIVTIEIINTNELKDRVSYFLIIEFTGKSSNIILTDHSNKILDCLKRSTIDSERSIRPSSLYTYPESDKLNPFLVDKLEHEEVEYNKQKFIVDNYLGISPLLAREIEHNNFDISLIKNLEVSARIYNNTKSNFYVSKLDHITDDFTEYESISEMLDFYFFNKDKRDRISQQSKDLNNFIKRQLNRNKNKLSKLKLEIQLSNSATDTKVLAEILQANLYAIKKGMKEIELLNFYNNENVTIKLDPRFDAVTNMNKYYKKYKKLKTSKMHLENQIILTNNEIKYFELLNEQLKHIDISGISEIRFELEHQGYLKKRVLKKTKKIKPQYEKYYINDTEILVGKNNLQNEFLTHKLAKRFEWWFHAKDMSGSHVIVRDESDDLSEDVIRVASNLASYFSKGQTSSSVPVNYTRVKNIKKIPGMKNCFVTYDTYKTIYIDPSFEDILKLNKK